MQDIVLAVDDDVEFLTAFAKYCRQYPVVSASTANEAYEIALTRKPKYAVVDMCLGPDQPTGTEVVQKLLAVEPAMSVFMLTGAWSEAYRIHAELVGAETLLPKRGTSIETVWGIESTLFGLKDVSLDSIDDAKWRQIAITLDRCNFNISETARRLGWRRTSLQRVLRSQTPPAAVQRFLSVASNRESERDP